MATKSKTSDQRVVIFYDLRERPVAPVPDECIAFVCLYSEVKSVMFELFWCDLDIIPDAETYSAGKLAGKPITYSVDKMSFTVTPVYREDSGKTIHDILLALMKRDGGIH